MRKRELADHGHVEDHDRGLEADLPRLLDRRRALLLGGAGLATLGLAACVPDPPATPEAGATSSTSAAGATTTTAAGAASTSAGQTTTTSSPTATRRIPEETAGPYPGDGSNGPDALTQSGIVRSDIRSSFGSASATAAGVPLTVKMRVLNASAGAAAYAGAAVYLWHCDAAGRYSMYSSGVTGENYLRGVQVADASGDLTFVSIFPGCYSGRWPHIHFEVYPDLGSITNARNKVRTSQMALPEDVSKQVYATSGYSGSASNLARTSLSRDMVFSDGYSLQVPAMTGSVPGGLTATLTLAV